MAKRRQADAWPNVDQDHSRYMALLGHNDLDEAVSVIVQGHFPVVK